MFKSILPSKKLPDPDFFMVTSPTSPTEGAKENYPALSTAANTTKTRSEKPKKPKGKGSPVEPVAMEQAFDKLLDELQIPDTLRPRLATMETSVKAAMLKSSATLSKGSASAMLPPATPHGLRKAHSSHSISSLNSLKHTPQSSVDDTDAMFSPKRPTMPPRGKSLDKAKAESPPGEIARGGKDKAGKVIALTPAKYCSLLTGTSSTQLDIEAVKKLRLMLRNESASWTEEFVWKGGYSALLTRLNEILEVEWREEQHDDQLLHELLRCVKAMSTSAVGCVALRSCCPTPFTQLISLLYSDKKPGDIGTRQLVVELILLLFELYPLSSLPSNGSPAHAFTHSRSRSTPWEAETSNVASSSLVTLPTPHATTFSLVRSLLLTPAPPPSEDPRIPVSPHTFIEELHVPRIYKAYLQELSDICRDYFWVFCHPNNTIWNLDDTDENKVEKPRAPGGMTGGVEFEAMSYMTMHFRLLNSVAAASQQVNVPKEHELSPHRLHSDLFMSGIDRIIVIGRKASTTYYPTLHLEIARYITYAVKAGYEIPWSVAKLIGPPPSAMCKPGSGRSSRAQGSARPDAAGSPRRTPGASSHSRSASALPATGPQLPVPRKVTPLLFG
ncbi:armadillo-type protein [Cytidiella melzeri]|nr:armadillo-type protein [Cytidiella melzeri]